MGRASVLQMPIVGLLAIAIGALVAWPSPGGPVSGPALATMCVLLVVLIAASEARRVLIVWDAFVLVIAGLLVFGYGFANVGVIPGIPLPLADLVIAGLGAYVISIARPWPHLPPAFIGAGLYGIIATCRLIVDFPTWGKDALRDYSLAVELLALPVGYWVIIRYGLTRFVRFLTWVFIAVIAYSWLYPVRDLVGTLGPTFGLQKPVALFGYFNGPALVSAFFFFTIMRPFAAAPWIAAAALPPIAIQQSRGLFVALPLAAILVAMAARGESGRGFRSGLALATVLGAIALVLSFAFSPAGRLGPTNATFIASQLGTLRGSEGPGAGSISHREGWLSNTLTRVSSHPNGWLIGLGLGPDLTDGFTSGDDSLVRKPHNDYLEAYARTGAIGLAALLITLALAVGPVIAGARRQTHQSSSFLWWVISTTVVFLFVAATQPLLAFPYGTIPLFTALGAGLAIAGTGRRDRA